MVDELAIQNWIHRSRPLFTSLSETLALNGRDERSSSSTIENAATISCTLQLLQEWITDNPCSDSELGDRILLLAARYRYVVLIGDSASKASTNRSLKELNYDLEALLSEVGRLGTDLGAHSGDS